MNNYLLQLLKEVKTIIIPGLGALTLTNEHTGEMMFMSYLKFDDGNLAKHIAEKEGIDINDAKNLIAKFVREVTAQLDKGESYDMYQFGTFRKVDGEVTFDQWGMGSATAETTAPKEEPTLPEAIIAAEAAQQTEENSIREELPVSESEAMGAAIAAAIVNEEPKAAEPAPVMEPIEEPVREEAVTAIVPQPAEETPVKEEAVVELTDKGFDTSDVPPAPPAQPFIIHESPLPVNDVPPVTKPEPGVGPSPKDIVEAKDAKAAQQKQKKTVPAAKPKRKTSVFSYILWGIVVLVLGGGTYVAVNYDTLKNDFPILADFAGESAADREPEKPVVDSTQVIEETPAAPAEEEVPAPEEVVPEPEPMPTPPPPVEKPKPVVQPKPAVQPKPSTPKPSTPKPSRPKPVSSGNSSIQIGQPDPSKPFHVIGGSFGSEANAKRFARELISKGQPSVIVGETNGLYRVSIASFTTKEEAVAAHANLKSIVPSAWVFKWP